MMPGAKTCATFLAVLMTVPALARRPGEPIKPGFNLFSKADDVALGQQAAAEIRKKLRVADNRDLQDHIARIGKLLAAQPEAEARTYQYSFTAVADKSINAFALPGGPTFIHTGLISAADNEAQVAGVMAHEIAHVALRHGTNQASKANLMQVPAVLVGVATGSNLWAQLTNLGATSLLLKFSRTAETQADLLGARIMSQAGYNPVEMARFFEKLEAEGGSRAPEFLSDHPNPGNRVKKVEQEITAFPRRNYNASAGDFGRLKPLVSQVPAASAPNSSAAAPAPAPVKPSSGFRQLRGQHFAFSHPDNWEVFGDPNSASITVAPREGVVQSGGRGGIGYGVVASFYLPERNRKDLKKNTEDLIKRLQATNPGLQIVSRDARRQKIDGSNGMLVQLGSESPFGGPETDMLLTVERPEGLFYSIFIAPQREFRNLEPAFNEIIKSIRFSN
ncbi:MAG: M48 family metallopeptidase [Bryobacteraceae bacterium]